MQLNNQKKIYKILVYLSQLDFEEIPFKSDINLTLLQDAIIIRLVNTQKILNFFRRKPNPIIKELIYIESKLIKIEHNFSQKNLAFKKKILSKNTSYLIFLKYLLTSIHSLFQIIKYLIVTPFIKSIVNNKFTFCVYSDLMCFNAPCIGRFMCPNLIRWTHNKCTLYSTLHTTSSGVLQLGKTSSVRFLTKINNIELFIYSEQFEPSRSTMCISIFVFVCTHILNNLSHVFTNHNEFTFVKPFPSKKTFLLLFVLCIYFEYPSKFKEKYGLFSISISNYMKTFDELPVNPKSIDRVYKFLFDLGLIKNLSVELKYSIMHHSNSEFHETQKSNANTSFKILSKLELVSSVKKESTHVASFFTFTLQTYNVIWFNDVTWHSCHFSECELIKPFYTCAFN